jgi:hypothetical protein
MTSAESRGSTEARSARPAERRLVEAGACSLPANDRVGSSSAPGRRARYRRGEDQACRHVQLFGNATALLGQHCGRGRASAALRRSESRTAPDQVGFLCRSRRQVIVIGFSHTLSSSSLQCAAGTASPKAKIPIQRSKSLDSRPPRNGQARFGPRSRRQPARQRRHR